MDRTPHRGPARLAALPSVLWHSSRPLRFLLVGCWNFVFGYLCFAAFYRLLSGRWPDWLILCAASVVGITNAFICHRRFTYRSDGPVLREYLKFYVVYGVQSLLNLLLFNLFVTRLGYNAYICQLAIALSLTFVSYWGHQFFSFRSSPSKDDNV